MSTFVRSSKYRHVFGTNAKREECYDQIKVTRSAWDTNKVAASTKSFSVIWEAGGGGSFVPINYEDSGKRTPTLLLFLDTREKFWILIIIHSIHISLHLHLKTAQ